jgi:hypothetical protein
MLKYNMFYSVFSQFLATYTVNLMLINVYSLQSIIWMIKSSEMGRILVGKREGKKPLGRPMNRWVDNIKRSCR